MGLHGRRKEPNPNDIWEEFPWMRGRAFVTLYPPIDPRTGDYFKNYYDGPFLCKQRYPELIPPGQTGRVRL